MLGSGGVHLNFSVVPIDKMFTNPRKLYKLAVLSLRMHVCVHLPSVYVCCDDDRNFQRVTGASVGGYLKVILRYAEYKSIIIRYNWVKIGS